MHIIAEIGSNWRSGSDAESKKRAIRLIKSAQQNGAKIVKFQLFQADKLWRKKNAILAVKELELPVGWLAELKQITEDLGMAFLVTPFYPDAVNVLEDIQIEFYKVAATDITYFPLLERIALTEKPVLLSTIGGKMVTNELDYTYDDSFSEVEQALDILRPDKPRTEWNAVDYNDIILMHCVSAYPAPVQELNLRRLIDLASTFMPLYTGFSSHCLNINVTASVVNYGASYIEIHYDLGDGKGREASHSYTPDMLQQLVRQVHDLEMARDCQCLQTASDAKARQIFRDPSDWLRPVK